MTTLRPSLALTVVLALPGAACSGDGEGRPSVTSGGLTSSLESGSSGESGETAGSSAGTTGDETTTTGEPEPFSCELEPLSPSLALDAWTHPAAGHLAGQTVTLVLQSQNTSKDDAPPLTTELVNRFGTRNIDDALLVGGALPVWYISVADLALGDNCITVRNGGQVEYAVKVVAGDPAPGVPRGDGVWKVTTNHQWTCDEQPMWGNLLHVYVEDEFGAPVEGATVNLRWTDDTVYPVPPDDAAMSWEEHGQPKTLTTNAEGFADLWTPWGEGIRSPIDGKPGFVVFLVSMAGGASDTATEITTGLWEADDNGCNYCPQDAVNVYGHWSHTVVFRRDPNATQVCEVGTDHAGQASCSAAHFFHDPDAPSCVPVAP
jgi:hypothetical protein